VVQCLATLAFFPPAIVGMDIYDVALISVPFLWLTIVAAVRCLIGVVPARRVSILIATGIACLNIKMVVEVQIGQSPTPPVGQTMVLLVVALAMPGAIAVAIEVALFLVQRTVKKLRRR
jgi:hypothetical protein